jgi:hypothetical protein
MKANLPKSWESLPKSQRAQITEHSKKIAIEAANEQLNKDLRLVLDLYIKMVCVVLHDAFGFGERRLVRFLGNHKRLFARQVRMVKDGSQIEYLNGRMAEIFKKDGFPQEFFDNMLGEVAEYEPSE